MFIDAEFWTGMEYTPCMLNKETIERMRQEKDGSYEAVSVSGRAYRISKEVWESM